MNLSCSFFRRSINWALLLTSVYLNSVRETVMQIGGKAVSTVLSFCVAGAAGMNEFVFSSIGGNLILLILDFWCDFFGSCSRLVVGPGSFK